MKKYDFILVYEHKVRELECLCFLKLELEKKGYTVLIKCIHENEIYYTIGRKCKPRYHAKVLGVFACYDNHTVRLCVRNCISFEKIVDLQWEQMIAKKQEQEGSLRNFKEIGKEAVHISWGEANRERLLHQANISEKNIFLCGNMSLDFLDKRFVEFYKSKKEICSEYGFPPDSKICILFANYRGADFDENRLDDLERRFGKTRVEVQKLGKKTQMTVLDWIKKAAEEFPNYIFIYRPHPGENTNWVKKYIESFLNIYIISDYSSKQWIHIADFMFSWHSTVVVEAMLCNKICYSLEPYGYVDEEDNTIFENIKGIKEYGTFFNVLNGREYDCGINIEKVENIFGVRDGVLNTVRVAQAFVKVYENKEYDISKSNNIDEIYTTSYGSIKEYVWANRIINKIYWSILGLLSKSERRRSNDRSVLDFYNRTKTMELECSSEKEIRNIVEKIKKCLILK